MYIFNIFLATFVSFQDTFVDYQVLKLKFCNRSTSESGVGLLIDGLFV